MTASELYEKHIALSVFFAKRFFHKIPDCYREEIVAEARVGLWKACKAFNSDKGTTFSTFAGYVIANNVLKWLEQQNRHASWEREVSFQAPISNTDHLCLGDTLAYEDDYSRAWVDNVLAGSEIIGLRLAGLTQQQIAAHRGCSQGEVSKELSRERRKLKYALGG